MIEQHDIDVLRRLGQWQAEVAESAANREKMDAWLKHDAGAPDRRPMVLMESLSWDEGQGPVGEADLECHDAWARGQEKRLRVLRHLVEVYRDDHVVPPFAAQYPAITGTDFGVPSARHQEAGGAQHSFNYSDAPLQALDDADFARLRHRTFALDRARFEQEREQLEAVFGGLLPVEVHDGPWQLATPLTVRALDLVGMENFLILLYDNPEGVHRLMAFLRDDWMAFIDFLEESQAWGLNNGVDYIGAGSMGLTRDLPAPDFAGKVRASDRWGGFESQESVGISPDQYHAFVFQYMQPLMARFGKVYYGCCEPVNAVWDSLKTVPNLARVSISPWADEERMGAICRETGIVYSRKPSPNFISAPVFDEPAFRAHVEKTVAAARGCRLEIIQRDVYTTQGQPDRLQRWIDIVREACAGWKATA